MCWEIVGGDDCNVVMQFVKNNWILFGMNANVISRIFKMLGKTLLLVNFGFKVIIKILSDRLSLNASRIISKK